VRRTIIRRALSKNWIMSLSSFATRPCSVDDIPRLLKVIRRARAPLVVVGKGAAYARAEREFRTLIDATGIPFLPSPMGKGVVSDSHSSNVSSAHSAAMKNADVVLMLGARLN
jgi:2-hydroxyacyl-CoA lyase 1